MCADEGTIVPCSLRSPALVQYLSLQSCRSLSIELQISSGTCYVYVLLPSSIYYSSLIQLCLLQVGTGGFSSPCNIYVYCGVYPSPL